jgi:NADPH-dependent 2,4-dienoyl-CoA reductase/sulfur reductase-like enzyme
MERGVLVDEHLQSSAADVYAAGDSAQVYDPLTGKAVSDTLWGIAREQGHAAGLNMAGCLTAYRKPVPFNVTRLAGITVTIIGAVGRGRDADLLTIARGDSETWRHLPDAMVVYEEHEVNRLRLVVGEKTLLGALVMGDQAASHPLQVLIRSQADITPIREQLLNPDAHLLDIIIAFAAGR